jgi:uncharacterized oxidoreductase
MTTVTEAQLKGFCTAILKGLGCDAFEQKIVTDHLALSNLSGHDSHGIGMLPTYVADAAAGIMKLNQRGVISRDSGSMIVVDGQAGFGQVMGHDHTVFAIERAKQTGLCLAGLINTHHIGRIGTYGEMCADAGLASIHMVNSVSYRASVAPWRGIEARISTNPICIAVPAIGGNRRLILDMATSQSAVGKVRVAYNSKKQVPPGRLIDSTGEPTTDPKVLFEEPKGALTPAGEHKGFALAFMFEVLAGCLTGGNTFAPGSEKTGGIQNNMMTIVFDPARLDDPSHMAYELKTYMEYIQATKPVDPKLPVILPGDQESGYVVERRKNGIPIDDGTWVELQTAAKTVGLSTDLLSLAG